MLTKSARLLIQSTLINDILLKILLMDRTSNQNIRWCTYDYAGNGAGFDFSDPIIPELISGRYENLIVPRVKKDHSAQVNRSREKAEVFTPSWICNAQNNLIDDAWFGIHRNRFNTEIDEGWRVNYYPISFRECHEKNWTDYVRATRMEISCGEAPYLTSRYDGVTGKEIPVRCRIGFLDRKLRVITENTESQADWEHWAIVAVQNVYGYDWQGDNILLARKNLLYTVAEHFWDCFGIAPNSDFLEEIAKIISWNIWQMDGIKYVIPESCHTVEDEQIGFFEEEKILHECPGCKTGNIRNHNGVYCKIRDWDSFETLSVIDILRGRKQ